MTKDLRQRRDGIVAYARKFYLHLADRVDVRAHGPGRPGERARTWTTARWQLTLAPLNADGSAGRALLPAPLLAEGDAGDPPLPAGRQRPRWSRAARARAASTCACSAAPATTRSTTRRAAASDIQDWQGRNVVRAGRGRRSASSEWKNPAPEADRPWLEPRNYGHWTVPMIQAYWEPNQGFMVGGGVTRTAWGFHRYPWENMQSFTLLYSTGYNNVRASYLGQWRLSDTSLLGAVSVTLLRDREHELLRLRQRDREDRRQDAVPDRDQRVRGLPGAALPAGHTLRAARRARGEGRPDEGRRQPRRTAAAVRDREVRRGGPARRLRVRLAGPHASA